MLDYFSHLRLFIEQHPSVLLVLGLFSVVLFLASILLVPWIVVKLPTNYFLSEKKRGSVWMIKFPWLYVIFLILKNIIGILLVLLGVILLIIPGQGLLTIFAGVLLMNFPGKYYMERRLLQSKIVIFSTTWLRARNNKPPFTFDE